MRSKELLNCDLKINSHNSSKVNKVTKKKYMSKALEQYLDNKIRIEDEDLFKNNVEQIQKYVIETEDINYIRMGSIPNTAKNANKKNCRFFQDLYSNKPDFIDNDNTSNNIFNTINVEGSINHGENVLEIEKKEFNTTDINNVTNCNENPENLEKQECKKYDRSLLMNIHIKNEDFAGIMYQRHSNEFNIKNFDHGNDTDNTEYNPSSVSNSKKIADNSDHIKQDQMMSKMNSSFNKCLEINCNLSPNTLNENSIDRDDEKLKDNTNFQKSKCKYINDCNTNDNNNKNGNNLININFICGENYSNHGYQTTKSNTNSLPNSNNISTKTKIYNSKINNDKFNNNNNKSLKIFSSTNTFSNKYSLHTEKLNKTAYGPLNQNKIYNNHAKCQIINSESTKKNKCNDRMLYDKNNKNNHKKSNLLNKNLKSSNGFNTNNYHINKSRDYNNIKVPSNTSAVESLSKNKSQQNKTNNELCLNKKNTSNFSNNSGAMIHKNLDKKTINAINKSKFTRIKSLHIFKSSKTPEKFINQKKKLFPTQKKLSLNNSKYDTNKSIDFSSLQTKNAYLTSANNSSPKNYKIILTRNNSSGNLYNSQGFKVSLEEANETILKNENNINNVAEDLLTNENIEDYKANLNNACNFYSLENENSSTDIIKLDLNNVNINKSLIEPQCNFFIEENCLKEPLSTKKNNIKYKNTNRNTNLIAYSGSVMQNVDKNYISKIYDFDSDNSENLRNEILIQQVKSNDESISGNKEDITNYIVESSRVLSAVNLRNETAAQNPIENSESESNNPPKKQENTTENHNEATNLEFYQNLIIYNKKNNTNIATNDIKLNLNSKPEKLKSNSRKFSSSKYNTASTENNSKNSNLNTQYSKNTRQGNNSKEKYFANHKKSTSVNKLVTKNLEDKLQIRVHNVSENKSLEKNKEYGKTDKVDKAEDKNLDRSKNKNNKNFVKLSKQNNNYDYNNTKNLTNKISNNRVNSNSKQKVKNKINNLITFKDKSVLDINDRDLSQQKINFNTKSYNNTTSKFFKRYASKSNSREKKKQDIKKITLLRKEKNTQDEKHTNLINTHKIMSKISFQKEKKKKEKEPFKDINVDYKSHCHINNKNTIESYLVKEKNSLIKNISNTSFLKNKSSIKPNYSFSNTLNIKNSRAEKFHEPKNHQSNNDNMANNKNKANNNSSKASREKAYSVPKTDQKSILKLKNKKNLNDFNILSRSNKKKNNKNLLVTEINKKLKTQTFSAPKIKGQYKAIQSRFRIYNDTENLSSIIHECNLKAEDIKKLVYLPTKVRYSKSVKTSLGHCYPAVPKLKLYTLKFNSDNEIEEKSKSKNNIINNSIEKESFEQSKDNLFGNKEDEYSIENPTLARYEMAVKKKISNHNESLIFHENQPGIIYGKTRRTNDKKKDSPNKLIVNFDEDKSFTLNNQRNSNKKNGKNIISSLMHSVQLNKNRNYAFLEDEVNEMLRESQHPKKFNLLSDYDRTSPFLLDYGDINEFLSNKK